MWCMAESQVANEGGDHGGLTVEGGGEHLIIVKPVQHQHEHNTSNNINNHNSSSTPTAANGTPKQPLVVDPFAGGGGMRTSESNGSAQMSKPGSTDTIEHSDIGSSKLQQSESLHTNDTISQPTTPTSPPSSPPESPGVNKTNPFDPKKPGNAYDGGDCDADSGNEGGNAKKKKWNLLGWIKKEMKIKDKDGSEVQPNGKNPSSGREKSGTRGKDALPQAHEKTPAEEAAEAEANARKVNVVSKLEDFPEECQKWIKQSGIPKDKLEANFKILMNVLHFRSGKIFKTPDMLNDPPRPVLPKSSRIKKGEELVTDALEFKKLYKDMEELGKGGFGTVFHARSVRDKKKPVAIKRMEHKTKKQKSANFHEASILSFCNHPNIVRYYTCHEIKDELWVVMELMEGGTFEDAAKAWHFSESNIAYIARELLKGIAYMHQNQLAHRDLKSANIMMSVRGEVKIIDLGLCADLSVGFPTHMVGSPFWMPPEMIQCKPHNSAVDIWSFAISLLEIANQRPPMIESAVKAMFTVGTEGVRELFVEPSKWSDVFKDFLGMCLKLDPEERATAEQLLTHPFIKLADSRANMENILRRIFLSNSLLNSGF